MPEVPQRLRPLGPDSDASQRPSAAIQQEISAELELAPTERAVESGTNTTTVPMTEFTYESSRYNQAALIPLKAISDRFPEQGEYVTVRINGRPVASGRVDTSAPADTGEITIDAYDTIRALKQATVTTSVEDQDLKQFITYVCATAGISPAAIHLRNNRKMTLTYGGRSAAKVLDDLAHRGRGVWFADMASAGGQPTFTDSINVPRRNIKHILPDTDPGLQTAPYDGVRVVGGPKAGDGSAGGGISKNPVTATAGQTKQGKRVYRHEDKSIRTQKSANRTAHSLLDEFQRQQGTGKIKLVGDERLQPLNTVIMPDELGGQEFLVSTVKHELSVSNGYTTTLTVGGLIDGERGPGQPVGVRQPSGGGGGGSGGGG